MLDVTLEQKVTLEIHLMQEIHLMHAVMQEQILDVNKIIRKMILPYFLG